MWEKTLSNIYIIGAKKTLHQEKGERKREKKIKLFCHADFPSNGHIQELWTI